MAAMREVGALKRVGPPKGGYWIREGHGVHKEPYANVPKYLYGESTREIGGE